MGYSAAQVADLAATIEATPGEVVVSGTPVDLTRVLSVSKPIVRARYSLREREPGRLAAAVTRALEKVR
jgi:predicted GTPase